ncbi:MAG: hypothetical protein CM15mP62_08290 [Rhodospirillaceae bacterium]|nr:MAG: hypothetical protein CM15mP62_08290 [Rhodospirillaceae bacterium]
MEQAIVDSVQLGGSVDKDLSIMGLFLAADPVVKAVMLGLMCLHFPGPFLIKFSKFGIEGPPLELLKIVSGLVDLLKSFTTG